MLYAGRSSQMREKEVEEKEFLNVSETKKFFGSPTTLKRAKVKPAVGMGTRYLYYRRSDLVEAKERMEAAQLRKKSPARKSPTGTFLSSSLPDALIRIEEKLDQLIGMWESKPQ
jgi:hypothetical protein